MSVLDDLKRIRDELDVIIKSELDKPLETTQKVTESATYSIDTEPEAQEGISRLVKDCIHSKKQESNNGFDGEGG